MDVLFYKQLDLSPGREYFIYIGELKAAGLNEFVRQGLMSRLGPDVGCISIISDALEQYPPGNCIVLNPEAVRQCRLDGRKTAVRIPTGKLAALASSHPAVLELLQSLLRTQDQVYIWMFESKPELELTRNPRVKLLGPDPFLSQKFNNKIWQYETFGSHVPMPEFRICRSLEDLRISTDGLRQTWIEGIFVSMEYSAAGMGSMVTRDCREMLQRFTAPSAHYLASRYLPHDYDPTVLAVTANKKEVFVAGVADMRIEGGNMFRGSTFPSMLPPDIQKELIGHTRVVGSILGGLGYRGIYGCDFIVDRQGRAWFIEVNTRKQGTTMEYCCTLEQNQPPGAANLLELEALAVLHGSFLDRCPVEPDIGRSKVHWGTYNYKVDRDVVTIRRLDQAMPERRLFAQAANGGYGGYIVMEHVGYNIHVCPGTFLGRVASAAADRNTMQQNLELGRKDIQDSIGLLKF